ncbi:MAG: anhydro-N-acetylmuramic acid kinase [Planctomycetota bacterium]|nr:MAG: anhydro-N-acetylmuramic acid kinase [Planctomycetota bacterium]
MSGWHELVARCERGDAVIAGVMSGTSADGIDVALVRAGGPQLAFEPLAFDVVPFEPALHARVRALLERRDGGLVALGELARLQRDLGFAFGRAARAVASAHGLALDLVASHGQTVWHHDGASADAATLQLGDGDCVSEAAGCAAASDFRWRDVAAGGQGAPLVALVERALFPRLELPGAVLNLGGIANAALFDARGELALNLDTGPCGALLDGLARRLYDEPFDRDGRRAAAGSADERLVAAWLAHPYFAAPPPKSTGRDTFGEAWLDRVLERARGARPEDVLASAVDFVAAHVALALEHHAPRAHGAAYDAVAPRELVVAGGGALHPGLLAALARRTRARVVASSAHGVDPKAREALAFALLGAHCVLGRPLDARAATGARAPRVLGKLSPWSAPESAAR